jgi:hypothetical protein
MVVLRKVGNYELNKGSGMANGLFNISNTENNNLLSKWFDTSTKDELMEMSDVEFEQMARGFCKE